MSEAQIASARRQIDAIEERAAVAGDDLSIQISELRAVANEAELRNWDDEAEAQFLRQ